MSAIAEKSPVIQLGEKMLEEFKGGPYESLQYVQSFVARKKKTFGQNLVSELVFHGADFLVSHDAASTAGTLLTWYIEGGAGIDFVFKLQKNKLDASNFCDIQRLIDFLLKYPDAQNIGVVDAIYVPIHLLIAKTPQESKTADLAARLSELEAKLASVSESAHRWSNAYKSRCRLQQMDKAAIVLNNWSAEGYTTEKPLFFGRAVLSILSDNKIKLAVELLNHLNKLVDDNINEDSKATPADGAHFAVWHVAVILTELANFPPLPRVDKLKLFSILYNHYSPLFIQIDPKLVEILNKIGENTFKYRPAGSTNARPNPLSMLQGLLGGGGMGGMGAAPRKASGRQTSTAPGGN